MERPDERTYWVEPGRLLAGWYPGDANPAQAEQKLQGLVAGGIDYIINLMEPDERNRQGQRFTPYAERFAELCALAGRRGEMRRWAIWDRHVPTRPFMREIVREVQTALAQGRNVYVHCWGGRGRTATVVGCYLRTQYGWEARRTLAHMEALTAHNKAVFRPIPQERCQREFIEAWETEVAA